jgi:hypothetical protein
MKSVGREMLEAITGIDTTDIRAGFLNNLLQEYLSYLNVSEGQLYLHWNKD